jgi:hypothetical protein
VHTSIYSFKTFIAYFNTPLVLSGRLNLIIINNNNNNNNNISKPNSYNLHANIPDFLFMSNSIELTNSTMDLDSPQTQQVRNIADHWIEIQHSKFQARYFRIC